MTMSNTSLLPPGEALTQLATRVKHLRLQKGFTQKGLSERAGIALSTWRRFEYTGEISSSSLVKALMVLDALDRVLDSLEHSNKNFKSLEHAMRDEASKPRRRGWLS